MSRPSARTAAPLLLWLLWFAYAVLVLQNILVGVAPGVVGLVGYYAWRVLVAVENLADGVNRLADARDPGESDSDG